MTGRRMRPDKPDGTYTWANFQSGDYFQHNGQWYGFTPNGHLAGLKNHTVVEHEDGTITVSPSILVSGGEGKSWHGYLKAGVWSEC